MNGGKSLRNGGLKWNKSYKNRIGKGERLFRKQIGQSFKLQLLLANNQLNEVDDITKFKIWV